MKILYLSNAIFPSEKSHSLSIMRVCQAFTDFGNEVILFGVSKSKNSPDPVKVYGLKGGFQVLRTVLSRFWVNPISRRLLMPGLILALRARNVIKQSNPDIIYSRLTITELSFLPRSLPVIYEMHSLGPFARSGLQRMFFRWILKQINLRRIIVTTNLLADMLRKEVPDIEIVVARLSADLPQSISSKYLAEFRGKIMNGSHFKYHVGYTGYLDSYGLRGTDIICKVAAITPDTAFHIVGGEPSIVEHWLRFSKKYNHYENIFFYGYRNPEEMPYFLSCFDVVLAPLQFRPLQRAPTGQNMSPLKLPQYMGYEKAIVASDIPSHQEVLENNHNAILVPCDDVSRWAEAINMLLRDQALRSTIGSNARNSYYKEFTPQFRVERILRNIT